MMPERAQSQPRFDVPVWYSDGQQTDSAYFGIIPNGHFCVDVFNDTLNGRGEFLAPPPPPPSTFYAYWICPRPLGCGTGCFEDGSLYCDYRPYVSVSQRDTFKLSAQLGGGSTMTFTWPAGLSSRFTALTLRFFDQVNQEVVTVNMLTNTSANVTNAGDPAVVSILSGGIVVSAPIHPEVPQEFALSQNFPNPFNPSTVVEFAVPQTAEIDLGVYNILGQKVTTLRSGTVTSGYYTASWNGTNEKGGDVSSGVYFIRMSATASGAAANTPSHFSAMRKLLLVR
jgi:hypothetical protein